jgi:hypothetical protein
MSLAEAKALTLYEYGGLFSEFNFRHADVKKESEAPDAAFVAQQMALLAETGVRIH